MLLHQINGTKEKKKKIPDENSFHFPSWGEVFRRQFVGVSFLFHTLCGSWGLNRCLAVLAVYLLCLDWMCTDFSCPYFLRNTTIYIMFTLYLVFEVSRDGVVRPYRIHAHRSLSHRNHHLPLKKSVQFLSGSKEESSVNIRSHSAWITSHGPQMSLLYP